MKTRTTRTIAKVITLSLLTATALHATNGANLISVGAKARGMGGTGIAVSHGAESALSNGAMITSVEGTEISFGGTLFMPDIQTQILLPDIPAPAQNKLTSAADTNMIPSVSIAHKINENWYIGVGMWGTAGMGTDYRGNQNITPPAFDLGNFNMVTNLQLLQFGVPIAYKTGGLSLSVTPIMQYGNLDINYDGFAGPVGEGIAQDFGFGYNLGFAYDFASNGVEGLTIGAMYKSAIEMNYDRQLSTAMAGFGVPFSDALEQPAEYGLGISYEIGQHTFAFDYKKIKWSSTKGYGDFGWENQDVYAFGYQYAQDNWALRAGYNFGSSAVTEQNAATYNGSLNNMLNLLGFPATAERHFTLGGSYELTEQFSFDLAYVYQSKNTETFSIASLGFGPNAQITTDHSEDSLSFQLNFKF